jgi:predicted transcriptional regulator
MTDATTSVKLSPKTKARIKKLAQMQRRSSHWVMREAIEQYVQREERQEKLRRDLVAAWEDYKTTGLHITGEEADAWLERLEKGEKVGTPKPHK